MKGDVASHVDLLPCRADVGKYGNVTLTHALHPGCYPNYS